jgi:hypothetical protein
VLDGVCRCGADGALSFVEVDAPTDGELHALLQTAIARLSRVAEFSPAVVVQISPPG